ncbi:MAG TPA: tetratricopeptide repeat protein [Prolixibacteraceae bacterium]|nr:tetratricopeptide repeat protein [Prolixibacteraceae bacterium]
MKPSFRKMLFLLFTLTMMQKIHTTILLLLMSLAVSAQLNTNHVIHTGRSRLYFGNYTGAIESFNMVIRMKPYLPEPYFYRGVAKLNLDDFYGALSDLNQALEIKPFYPEAYMYRGVVHYNLAEYSLAMEDYSEAMKLDGENADIYNNRGICKAGMREFNDAIDDYTLSIELKPKNFNAYLNRSIAYQLLEEWDKAIADCNQLIRIRPNSPMGYMSRGLIKIEKEDFAGALRDFDMAIYLDPQNAYAYQNRGMVKQQLESFEAAIMDYTSAINIDNRMASAYFNRGIAREMLRVEGYQKDYDNAALLDTRFSKRPWLTAEEHEKQQQQMQAAWLANPNLKEKEKEEQKEKADSIQGKPELKIDLDELQKRKMKANLVVEDNRDIPGKEAFESARIQDQNINISLLHLFGISAINKNNQNETFGYFSMIIEQLNEEYNYQPYLTLTNETNQSANSLEFYNNQILIFDQLISQNNQLSNNYLYRGIFKFLINDFNVAINDFSKAIELNERNLLAYLMRANSRVMQIETIENLTYNPTLSTFQQSQQSLLSRQNKEKILSNEALDEILTDYSIVLYMNPDFQFGYYNRANIYVKNERYFEALDEYNKAIKIDNEFAEAYYNRGLVKILLNDISSGAKDLSRAGELGISESYNVIKRYCY